MRFEPKRLDLHILVALTDEMVTYGEHIPMCVSSREE